MIPGMHTWQKVRVMRAIFALSKRPRDTTEVFSIIDAVDTIGHALPATERERYVAILRDCPGFTELYEAPPPLGPYDLDTLGAMPEGTLAHAYATHMRANHLKPDFYPQVAYTDPLRFARLRLPQTHDIIHTITGFDTSPGGEYAVQAFYLEQLPASPVPVAILASGFLRALETKDFTIRSELLASITRGYEMGKRAKSILFRRWEDDWSRNLDELRMELGFAH